jgi:hypothetical protein
MAEGIPQRRKKDGSPEDPTKPEIDMTVNQDDVLAERRRWLSFVRRLNADRIHSMQNGGVPPKGFEPLPFSEAFADHFGIPEAKGEAICNDAALRDIVQAWSTLGKPVQHAILLLVKSDQILRAKN